MKSKLELFMSTDGRHAVANTVRREVTGTPLLLTLMGSHVLGIAGPDSDFDVRGIFIASTSLVLSLFPHPQTFNREEREFFIGTRSKTLPDGKSEIEDVRVDIDFQVHEIEKVFRLLLKGNGNIVEMLLSPLVIFENMAVDWKEIGRAFVTKRLANHYRGFFRSMKKRAAHNRGRKNVIYAFREIILGTMLMLTGEMIFDLHQLLDAYEATVGSAQIVRDALAGEEITDLDALEKEWNRMEELFDAALERSPLPDEPSEETIMDLNDTLLHFRTMFP